MEVEPLTPEKVLDVLREHHRQMSANGDAFGFLSFDMDSTVEDWRDAMMADIWKWKEVGAWLNWLFRTHIGDEVWRELLVPTKSKKLRPVCERIAETAVIPVVKPLAILGLRCEAAGVFLSLRDQLQARGLDVSQLGPSTPIEPILIDHADEFYPELIKFGPGRIPKIRVRKPLYDCCLWGLFVTLAASFVAVLLGAFNFGDLLNPGAVSFAVILLGADLLLVRGLNAASEMKPRRIGFGELRDFRDLCRLLVVPAEATVPAR